eukprot:3936048-Rhodomonas_salina.2
MKHLGSAFARGPRGLKPAAKKARVWGGNEPEAMRRARGNECRVSLAGVVCGCILQHRMRSPPDSRSAPDLSVRGGEESACAELGIGLLQLLPRVHHDRASERHRLTQRQPRQQQHVGTTLSRRRCSTCTSSRRGPRLPARCSRGQSRAGRRTLQCARARHPRPMRRPAGRLRSGSGKINTRGNTINTRAHHDDAPPQSQDTSDTRKHTSMAYRQALAPALAAAPAARRLVLRQRARALRRHRRCVRACANENERPAGIRGCRACSSPGPRRRSGCKVRSS